MVQKSASRDLDKYILRMLPGMRQRIAQAAAAANRSMNAEIVHRLSQFEAAATPPPPPAAEQASFPKRSATVRIEVAGAPAVTVAVEAQLPDSEFAWLVRDTVRDVLDQSDEHGAQRLDALSTEPDPARVSINLTAYPLEPMCAELISRARNIDADAQEVRAGFASRGSRPAEPEQRHPPDPEAEQAPASSGSETQPPAGGAADPPRALSYEDVLRRVLAPLSREPHPPVSGAADGGRSIVEPTAAIEQFRGAILATLPPLDAGVEVTQALNQLSARLSSLPQSPPKGILQRFCDLFALAFGRLAEQYLDVEDVPAAGTDTFGVRVRIRSSECAAAALRAVDDDLFGGHGGSPDPVD